VIALDGEHRLPIPVERRVLHSVEIRRDEREDLDVVVKRDSVTFVPEIGLIRAVSSLAHIDGLDIRGGQGTVCQGGAYENAARHGSRPPYQLPESWLKY